MPSALGGRWIEGFASPFLEGVNCVDGQVFKSLNNAARPANLDPFDLGARTEAEVHAHVAIGDVARAAANFVDERARTSFHSDLRADAVAIGFVADRAKRNPVIAVVNVVHQAWVAHSCC